MNNNSDQLLTARSLGYAEDFVKLPEPVIQARNEAVATGAPVISTGELGFLTFIAKAIGAKNAVEIGTATGASGLALHYGMGNDSVLTSIDTETDWQQTAREQFNKAGLKSHQFRLIAGQPLKVLNNLRAGAYDIVFINGDKLEYVEYVDQAFRLLRDGGVLIMHDALWHNLIADPMDESDETVIIREALQVLIDNEQISPVMIPLGNGIALCIKE